MGIASFFKNALMGLFSNLTDEAPNFGKEIIHMIKVEIWKFERRLIKNLIAVFILLLGFAALALSFAFFLIEYVHLSKTISLLIIGIILLFVGIILKIGG